MSPPRGLVRSSPVQPGLAWPGLACLSTYEHLLLSLSLALRHSVVSFSFLIISSCIRGIADRQSRRNAPNIHLASWDILESRQLPATWNALMNSRFFKFLNSKQKIYVLLSRKLSNKGGNSIIYFKIYEMFQILGNCKSKKGIRLLIDSH